MTLQTRLQKLEKAYRPQGAPVYVFQWNESREAALERWRREHSCEDLEAGGRQVFILEWGAE
jgi:hypothetical protein